MKLYTENQVEQMLRNFFEEEEIKLYLKEFYTPIELPSDDEIEKANPYNFGSHVFGTRGLLIWEQGVNWLKDKIQGGNK